MKLLLDENVSPWVALELKTEGWDAVHVRERGLLGAADHEVFARAFEEDRLVVTANVGDFEVLAAASELHCGVICLEDAALSRQEQIDIIRSVIETLQGTDLINALAYVRADGSIRTFVSG